MTNQTTDAAAVEQRHRDAAADLWLIQNPHPGDAHYAVAMQTGRLDDYYLVQAFVKFEASLILAATQRAEQAEKALATMVYETTHLSPTEEDGSHWCKISAEALSNARAALATLRSTPSTGEQDGKRT